MLIDGNEDNGFTTSFDENDDGLDLNFDLPDDPQDLNLDDMAGATKGLTTDLSGAQPTVNGEAPAQPAPSATPASPGQDGAQAPAPSAPPGQSPQQANAPAAQPGQQPANPAGAQQQPQTPQAGPTEQPQPSVDIEQYVAQNADAIVDNLVKSHFKIDDATAEALQFTPEVKEFVEKRDAKNFLLTMVQVNNALRQTLPVVVAQLMEVASEAKKTQDTFYGEFPELADKKFVPHLRAMAQTLRTVHPQMERAAFQTLLGATALQAFGIQRQAPAQAPAGGAQRQLRRGPARSFTPAGAVQPQRNLGGNGAQAPVDPLAFMSQALRMDME